ncbi:MAG: diaminopimelate epimerase [Pyrinomonadaceae bacterium]
MSIPFTKFHGFGNDYIVIERDDIPPSVSLSELAKAICTRNTGAGSDGIAVVHPLATGSADYFCEIINPDGSTAGFSGNGTRCAVAYLHYKGLWSEPHLRLETRRGIKKYDLIERKGVGEFWFEAEIGNPRFASEEVPALTAQRREAVVNEPIESNGRHYAFSAVNIGNPVACIFVDNFDLDWRSVGRELETHEMFPERSNIVFVKIDDRENIEIRIWERGAGETTASGTCSSAAAILSAFMLKTERKVMVHSEGGTTDVLWRDDDEIVITGRADLSYSGEWPLS